MLKIKHKYHLDFPHLKFSASNMRLSPVTDDSDDLAQAISQDPDDHDNNWQLDGRPDEVQLEEFWSRVQSDIRSDPEWYIFED